MTIFARPSEWTRPSVSRAEKPAPHPRTPHYFAFLSYSHRDEDMAKWLHEELENFRVPRHLVGKLTDNGPVPKRLTPIFRDIGELPASDDLGTEISACIAGSRFLIVLCSPSAAASKWTNAEIEAFKRARPEGCIFAAIVDGEPFASEIPGRESEECLPKALRHKYDRRGRATARRAEPLAADLRMSGEARRVGVLKLVAGMLGLGLDELIQRESQRRHRRMMAVTAGSVAGMLVATGLAVTAVQSRDAARDQRRQAESLVGFMLGDLRDKLEPLGRLDVLDSVGTRALEYYEQQDKAGLSDESLTQRSKALTLMGEIAQARGDLVTAMRLYREAHAGTAEALRRGPGDPQRLFDHAQNVFWIGYIDWLRGDLAGAEAAFRTYKALAERMVALEPQNPMWRLEGKYADTNLGTVLMEQRRFPEAADAFQTSLAAIEALAASEPANGDYQKALLEALAWLADARKGEGRLEEALAQRERQLDLLEQLIAAHPGDKEYVRKATTAHKAVSQLIAARDELGAALDHARRAVGHADTLLKTEPDNTEWLDAAADSKLNLASLLRVASDREGAASAARAGCDIVQRLIAKNPNVRSWNEDLRLSCLVERSRIAIAAGETAEGVSLARQAGAVAESSRGKTPADAAIYRAVAFQLLGDAHAAAGEPQAAREAWRRAAQSWPKSVRLEPDYLAQHDQSLRSAGERAGAARIAARLEAIGYRHPGYAISADGG